MTTFTDRDLPFGGRRPLLLLLAVVAVGCSGRQPSGAPPRPASTRSAAGSGMEIFLLAGQSNMAGRARVEAQDSVVNARVLRLDRNMTWVPAVDPLHWDKPAIIGVGPGRAFGLAIAAREPAARIGLVPAAVGGSPIASWEPGALDTATNTHPYDDAMARMRVALKDGTVRAILWHQGESDATPARSVVYAEKLRALIARFRSELGDPTLPFVIGQLGQFDARPWTADVRRVDSVHRAIAATVPNVAYVSSDGLRDKGDGVHFDGPAARALGERYAAAYLKLRGCAGARVRGCE
ncbi:MAG TPA: sialate O-acetylesterase [Gemmatimonadaceae bacterium]|nr:sialate O-acetylesterase [Gemmatimonadaceae bacterium]